MTPATVPRIGLVGCGLWGTNILRDLRGLGARVLVVDIDPGARQRALDSGAAAAFHEPSGGLDVEGWIVATPARAHAASIGAIDGGGLPILCEKPLTTSPEEARALAASLRSPLHVMDVWRYHPAVEALQRIVLERELGAVHGLTSTRTNWTSPRLDVDTAWNLAPHEISIYRQVFGELPEPMSAFAESIDGQVRSMWIRWGPQPWMMSELSNRHATRRRELRLHCERGVAHFDGAHPELLELASGASDHRLEATVRRQLPLEAESALVRQLRDWLGFVQGGGEPRSNLAYAVDVVSLVDRVRATAAPVP